MSDRGGMAQRTTVLALLFATGPIACATASPVDCGDYQACIELASDAHEAGDATTTRRYLEAACNHEPAGCNQLGDHLGAASPGELGAELAYKRACSGNNAEGCARLGRLYARSDGARPPNAARAHQSLSRACELDASYCEEAGRLIVTAIVAQCSHAADCMAAAWFSWEIGDVAAAAASFEQACALGDPGGCEEAGYLLVGWGDEIDYQRGMGLLQRACTMGRVTACQALMNGAQTP